MSQRKLPKLTDHEEINKYYRRRLPQMCAARDPSGSVKIDVDAKSQMKNDAVEEAYKRSLLSGMSLDELKRAKQSLDADMKELIDTAGDVMQQASIKYIDMPSDIEKYTLYLGAFERALNSKIAEKEKEKLIETMYKDSGAEELLLGESEKEKKEVRELVIELEENTQKKMNLIIEDRFRSFTKPEEQANKLMGDVMKRLQTAIQECDRTMQQYSTNPNSESRQSMALALVKLKVTQNAMMRLTDLIPDQYSYANKTFKRGEADYTPVTKKINELIQTSKTLDNKSISIALRGLQINSQDNPEKEKAFLAQLCDDFIQFFKDLRQYGKKEPAPDFKRQNRPMS